MHIYPGSEHSIALTSDGGVFTWGSSRCGQLGHGTTSSEILPRRILELMGTLVTQVERRNCRWPLHGGQGCTGLIDARQVPPLPYSMSARFQLWWCGQTFYSTRPTSSCLITSVKQYWAELVLWWVTAW